MPSLREQRALTVARIRDEFARSGSVPGELVAFIQQEVFRRGGGIIPADKAREMLGDYVDVWTEQWLRGIDNEDDDKSRRGRSKAQQIAELRREAADRARERAERAAHKPKTMITKG